jgi:small-conductance mechanosensitive channel
MGLSDRTTQALLTAGIGIAAVIAVRFSLVRAFSAYERRVSERDAAQAARLRTTLGFLQRVIVAIVAAIAVWSVLSLYSATTQIANALLASSAVLALIAGLALSTPLSNLGSGMLVAFAQPLRLGDRVTVADQTGFVEEMSLSYTTLVTDDGRRVFIPNSQLTSSTIVNRTIRDPRRAVGARFPIGIDAPIGDARDAVRHAVARIEGTMADEARVLVGEIGEHVVWLDVTAYAPLDADVAQLASDVHEAGLDALREGGFLRT